MELDIDHLRQWIGREESHSEELTRGRVDQFNATFDREATEEDAPLLIHLCLALPAAPTTELGPDGHAARGGFLPPVALPRRMWAGGEFIFHGPIRVGETVTRRSVIRDVALKQGRSGALCFVTVDHEITSDGRPALTERHDIVYRDVTATPRKTPDAAPQGAHSRTVTPSAPLLFRYSALTFNGHRIHYDKPYTTGTEGYPGLVVHGPMQATLLCQFAADLQGRAPKVFSFRSLSPLFDDVDFSLNAEEVEAGLRLWTAASGGPVAMEALATW